MSKEELDRLNAEGKAWRERNKPAQEVELDPHRHFHKFTPETTPAIQQLDLWEEENK
jgi:hypothetical protein